MVLNVLSVFSFSPPVPSICVLFRLSTIDFDDFIDFLRFKILGVDGSCSEFSKIKNKILDFECLDWVGMYLTLSFWW